MADQSLQILIEFIQKGGPEAEKALASVRKAAAEGSADAQKALQELGKEQADSTEATKRETAATEKSTAAKKAQSDALRGLSRLFPTLIGHVRAGLSPLGAAAIAIGAVASRLRQMGQEARAIEQFNREIENLKRRGETFEQLRATFAAGHEAFIRELHEKTDAVGKFRQEIDRMNDAVVANRELNADMDDTLLKSDLLDIDASNDSPANKATRKARRIRESERDKAAAGISNAEKDAQRDFANAGKATEMQKRFEQQSADLVEPLAQQAARVESAETDLEVQKKLVEKATTELDAQIVAFNTAIRNQRGDLMQGAFMTVEEGGFGEHMSMAQLKSRRDQLVAKAEELRRSPDDMKQLAANERARLAQMENEKAKAQAEAEAAKAQATALTDSGRAKLLDADGLRNRFKNLRPIQEGFEDRERAFSNAQGLKPDARDFLFNRAKGGTQPLGFDLKGTAGEQALMYAARELINEKTGLDKEILKALNDAIALIRHTRGQVSSSAKKITNP